MIEQTYFLDMIPGESTPPVVHVSQFDVNSRTLTFNLMKGGVAFVPDAGMSVTLDGMKPDNHVFSYPMTVNGSSVSIDVLDQMTVVSGHVRCEVSVSNQNGKIGSANFILAVEKSPIDSGSISESDIPIFEDLKNQAQQAAADAEQSASDAEGFAADAETAATSVSAMMATVESTSIASKAYSVGDYLVLNGKLYEVTRAIIRGGRLTVGTNISETTVGGELTSLNSNLSSLEDEVDSIGTATSIEDTEPYLFKSSARENVVGNIMSVHKIIGGTVAWNQLCPSVGEASYWKDNSITNVTRTTNSITFTASAANGNISTNSSAIKMPFIIGHKYLVCANIKLTTATDKVKVELRANTPIGKATVATTNKQTVCFITVPSAIESNADYLRIIDYRTSGWDAISVDSFMCFDLTQMFGSAIADYIYSLEQANTGAGVAWFKKLFPKDYYAYNAGELISVKTSAHVMRDANNNIIGNYALDPDLELRGMPKIADGKLYYDGDEYEPSGTVTRKYGIVDLGTLTWVYPSANIVRSDSLKTLIKASSITSVNANCIAEKYNQVPANITLSVNGTYAVSPYGELVFYFDGQSATPSGLFVYELATPTTESAVAYDKQQVFDVTGTEEYVDTRTVPIPVGHDTFFPTSLTSRIDALEDEFDEEITVLSESIAPTEIGTATQNYAVGSYLMLNNRFCKVTSPIATGEQIIVGSNVRYTTVAEELTAILAQINA